MSISPSADVYREEAERCRQLAITCRNSQTAARWRELAKEYVELAESFEAFHASVNGQRRLAKAAKANSTT